MDYTLREILVMSEGIGNPADRAQEGRWRSYSVDSTCQLYLPFFKYGGEQTKILDISGNNNHGAITGAACTSYPMLQKIASGSVTQANMRISAVDGTAFVDFSAASVLTDYVGKFLRVKDSSGNIIQGHIKAAGTGETLDTELVVDGAFTDTANWTEEASWAVAGGVATYDDINNGQKVSQIGWNSVDKCLYKLVFGIASAGTARVYILDAAGDNSFWDTDATKTLTTGTHTYYRTKTVTSAGISVWGYTAGDTFTIDNLSLKKVLTPSTTGVTIVNTPGGTTYNWVDKGTSFNYNDSSNYTYEIFNIAGYEGSVWQTDGVDDVITITDNANLRPGTGDFTLLAWVRYPFFGGLLPGIFTKGMTSAIPAHTWGLMVSGNPMTQINFQTATDAGGEYQTNSGTIISSEGWHLIAFVKDITGENWSDSIYLDGILESTTIGAGTPSDLSSTSNILIGKASTDRFLKTNYGEIVYFNRALSAEEIGSFYEQTRSRYGV